MENRNKSKNYGIILIAALLIAFIVSNVLIAIMNSEQAVSRMPSLSNPFFISCAKGVITSLQMLVCIILASMRQKSARVLAHFLPAFTLVSSTLSLIRLQNKEIIPGITTMFVCLIAVIIIYRQISKREKEAFTDYLTGMNNRRSIMLRLNDKIKAGKPFSVLYIDIDDFKYINDNYGHEAGDEVIRTVAKVADSNISSKDVFGRIGGDEFILMLNGVNRTNDIVAEIRDELKKPIPIQETGSQIFITASIGVARFPDNADNAQKLIHCADMALYNVKTNGKNDVRYFEEKFRETMKKNAYIESLANKYLAEKSFTFEYQPQYHTETKTLRGFETLIRIRPEDCETVPIQDLIDVAEHSDLIFQIDSYVLRYALAEFKETALKHPELILSVNASAKHISKKGFVELVEKALDENSFPAENLEIEITEYCLAGSPNLTIENMNRLRAKGIKIALDDFG
ncbi:MAG: diguanylate cyclase, partial [Oscillospiraceae bacterium]|nr:diguanylate cyclase [Oscillospiraceae bacterium]